jgi:aminoglycoside/choline kinase family phosphotransferase
MDHPINSTDRGEQRRQWIARVLASSTPDIEPASVDASFRSYWRVRDADRSLIVMDAPPDKEDCRPFLDVARRLRAAGLHAPEVFHSDLEQGFLLLEDMGDTLFRDLIDDSDVDPWFGQAFDTLERFAKQVDASGLPKYDQDLLRRELDLFTDWFLDRQLGQELDPSESAVWESVCEQLIRSAREQPQVFVHRDFHSCNLMRAEPGPGIIDFQDAVLGPISYDLISLLLDRYISWPRDRYLEWVLSFRQRLGHEATHGADPDQWIRWCDWMGLQRNLKVVGIFARLNHRDGKPHYLELQPRFFDYVLDTVRRYPEFEAFHQVLERRS